MQPLGSFFNRARGNAPIPAQTVEDIINRKRGAVRISSCFRVTDTNRNRIPVMVKPTNWNTALRGTFDPTDISPLIAPDASLNQDMTRAVPRQMSFTMIDPAFVKNLVTLNPVTGTQGFPFNPIYNFLEVAFVMRNVYRGDEVEFEVPLGHYVMFLPNQSITPGAVMYQWTGLDFMSLVVQTPFIGDWVAYQAYPGGVLQAATDMLVSGSIPISLGGTGLTSLGNDDAGPAVPPNMVSFDQSLNQPIAYDIDFQAGSGRVDAINKLLSIIQYTNCWVRTRTTSDPNKTDVQFVTSPTPYTNGAIPTIGWDYSTSPASSIVESPISVDFSSQADSRICNIVKVEGSPANGTPNPTTGQKPIYSSLQSNSNPNSVISLSVLKTFGGVPRAITQYQRQDLIFSQALADLYANDLLQRGAQLPEQIRVNSLHNPLHEFGDVLIFEVTVKGDVRVPSSIDSPFVETSWSLPLKAQQGRMSHTLERIVPL